MAEYDLFEFRCRTRVLYGAGSRSELAFELEQLGARTALLCTDPGLVRAGVTEQVAEVLRGSSVQLLDTYDGILQDARVGPIQELAARIRDTGAEAVVALGGGSVMDSVKAAVHMIGHGREDFQELLHAPVFDFKPLMPHVAIPTTAGTGCEVTFAAVIYNEAERIKGGFVDPYCSADVALLDPELTLSLPPRITAFTGMDALTHGIEAYVSKQANPFSDALAIQAVRSIARALPEAVRNGRNREARGEMLIASCMAGIAFIQSMTGAAHSLAHALGGRFGIPHGLANAIVLPLVMEANLAACPDRFRDIAAALGEPVHERPVEQAAAAVRRVRALKQEVGLTDRLGDLGIDEQAVEEAGLVDLAMEDGQFAFNPKDLCFEEVREILLRAL